MNGQRVKYSTVKQLMLFLTYKCCTTNMIILSHKFDKALVGLFQILKKTHKGYTLLELGECTNLQLLHMQMYRTEQSLTVLPHLVHSFSH